MRIATLTTASRHRLVHLMLRAVTGDEITIDGALFQRVDHGYRVAPLADEGDLEAGVFVIADRDLPAALGLGVAS